MTLGPLIVQSDNSLLLETYHQDSEQARQDIAVFAELERAPEHIHTYRVTRLGLWNARAAGHTAAEILATLKKYAKFEVPHTVATYIEDTVSRYGRLEIVRESVGDAPQQKLILRSDSPAVLREVSGVKKIAELLTEKIDDTAWVVADFARGELKQLLLQRGWPAADNAGFRQGDPHEINLSCAETGELAGAAAAGDEQPQWQLRDYQERAAQAFIEGGSGVVVLPCGAGKTIVGAAAMAAASAKTLILVTNTVSARQWRDELLRRTDLLPEDIGEYSGQAKEVKPVTIATYQILTSKNAGKYAHLALLDAADWGLVIYDEVHLLPAPVFKLTADLQARRRLGLTATLVREDGREGQVFSLIGPKRFDASWKELEKQGAIAAAACYEVRVELGQSERDIYAVAADRDRYRLAACAAAKTPTVAKILSLYPNRQKLVIGQYIAQLHELSAALGAPLVTGETPIADRESLFADFRAGKIDTLVVSKVANFSVDLPEASVAVQVSGAFGSRQEEAQRLGRILRPKREIKRAVFYTVVTKDTVDQDFAFNRQRFLTEQGYLYKLMNAQDVGSELAD